MKFLKDHTKKSALVLALLLAILAAVLLSPDLSLRGLKGDVMNSCNPSYESNQNGENPCVPDYKLSLQQCDDSPTATGPEACKTLEMVDVNAIQQRGLDKERNELEQRQAVLKVELTELNKNYSYRKEDREANKKGIAEINDELSRIQDNLSALLHPNSQNLQQDKKTSETERMVPAPDLTSFPGIDLNFSWGLTPETIQRAPADEIQ